MNKYQIWIEGYAATGERSPASLIGTSYGEDFKDACRNFRYVHDIKDWQGKVVVKKGSPLKLETRHDGNYAIWACRLFDNEADARKSFG